MHGLGWHPRAFHMDEQTSAFRLRFQIRRRCKSWGSWRSRWFWMVWFGTVKTRMFWVQNYHPWNERYIYLHESPTKINHSCTGKYTLRLMGIRNGIFSGNKKYYVFHNVSHRTLDLMPQMNVTVLSVAKLGPFALGIESSLLLGRGWRIWKSCYIWLCCYMYTWTSTIHVR